MGDEVARLDSLSEIESHRRRAGRCHRIPVTQFKEFPHQSTADQFFSESQFESYRRLGLHVLRSAFEGVDNLPAAAQGEPQRPLVTLFQDLTRKWYAPIAVTPETASRLADAYTDLMTHLAADPDTRPLFDELQSGKRSTDARTPLPTAIVSAVMTVLQLMENVHTEFRFELPLNVQNPRNEGWISTFRRWRRPRSCTTRSGRNGTFAGTTTAASRNSSRPFTVRAQPSATSCSAVHPPA